MYTVHLFYEARNGPHPNKRDSIVTHMYMKNAIKVQYCRVLLCHASKHKSKHLCQFPFKRQKITHLVVRLHCVGRDKVNGSAMCAPAV